MLEQECEKGNTWLVERLGHRSLSSSFDAFKHSSEPKEMCIKRWQNSMGMPRSSRS